MTSAIVCAEVSFSKNPHYLYCKSIDWFPYDKSPFYCFTGGYSRTDQNVFSEIPFNGSSHYIGTSQFIYTANQLTGFCKAWVYRKAFPNIHHSLFSKNRAIEKPANLSLMVINWLDFVWYELTLKGISEQTLLWVHLLVELSLARLSNSHWHNASIITGTIV